MSTRRRRSAPRTVLSLYTGAGGLDLGLEAAGFDLRLCVEIDEDCRKTLATNRPGWQLAVPSDVHELTPEEALVQARLRPRELTLLAGGPPCQPFSKSGYWLNGDAGRLTDPRAATLDRYLDFVEVLLPEVLLLENVEGLVYRGKDEGLRLVQERLDDINLQHGVRYQATVVQLQCAHYGVPQARGRVFVIASRSGKTFSLPDRTHYPAGLLPNAKAQEQRTAWDAIGDLDSEEWPEKLNPKGKWGDLLRSIPEGENYLWHTPRGGGEPLFGWRTRYWSFLLKLAKDRPAWTIQAVPGPATGPFHWRSRQLSELELRRIQTFPDNYSVAGDYRSQHRQLGNAVPPAIGEMLGREIRRQFFDERPRRRASFVPERCDECPPPLLECSVPVKYLKLRGNHTAHPGVGKGPGAIRRTEQDGD